MRTLDGVMAIIREEDPDSSVSRYLVRRVICCGLVPVLQIGRRKLVDADKVIEFLASGVDLNELRMPESGITPVPAKMNGRREQAWTQYPTS
jgi:hypothetical protein